MHDYSTGLCFNNSIYSRLSNGSEKLNIIAQTLHT